MTPSPRQNLQRVRDALDDTPRDAAEIARRAGVPLRDGARGDITQVGVRVHLGVLHVEGAAAPVGVDGWVRATPAHPAAAARQILAAWRDGRPGVVATTDAADAATVAVCELHETDPDGAMALRRALTAQEGALLAWPAREGGP